MNPISAILDIGSQLIGHFFPNAADANAAKLKLLELQQSGQLAEIAAKSDLAKAQAAINQVEAANKSIFVAGWRPFVGWCCGASFCWQFIGAPLVAYIAALSGWHGTLPTFDYSQLMTVLMGMLGLAGMRSYEKVSGVQTGK